jgi:hypothetical protein
LRIRLPRVSGTILVRQLFADSLATFHRAALNKAARLAVNSKSGEDGMTPKLNEKVTDAISKGLKGLKPRLLRL